MEFWIVYSLICLLFYLVEFFIPEMYKKYFQIIFVAFLIVISGFRYEIGSDYNVYADLFYGNGLVAEASFNWIIDFLNWCGFDYQMLFFTYSALTMIFIYLGCRYYGGNTNYLLCLYALIPMFYWNSFSIIRQALAVSILFWSSKFLIDKNNKKFICGVLLAVFFHYASIVFIISYYFVKKEYKFSTYFIVIFVSLLLGYSGAVLFVFDKLSLILGIDKLVAYVNVLTSEKISISKVIIQLLTYSFCCCSIMKGSSTYKEKILLNLYTIGTALYFLFLDIALIGRAKNFYDIFMIIIVFYAFNKLNFLNEKFGKILFLCGIIFYFLFTINQYSQNIDGILYPTISANNINYQFNFRLWKN